MSHGANRVDSGCEREYLESPVLGHPYYWAAFVPIGAWGPLERAGAGAKEPAAGSGPAPSVTLPKGSAP